MPLFYGTLSYYSSVLCGKWVRITYVNFFDGDDIWDDAAFEKAVGFFEANYEAIDFVACNPKAKLLATTDLFIISMLLLLLLLLLSHFSRVQLCATP